MPHVPGPAAPGLLIRAQLALSLNQEELSQLLGVSRRTVQRLSSSEGMIYTEYMLTLARAVHPRDPALAAELAAEGGQTLERLGIVRPAPPPPAAPLVVPPMPAPPPRALPPTRLMVESIVCAAADTMQTPPAAVRDVLRAAFARARGLGLTVDEIDAALSPPPAPEVAAPEPPETGTAAGVRRPREPDGRRGRQTR